MRKKNPDVIRRVRAAFDDLGKAVRERPNDVIAALKKMYPDLPEDVLKLSFEQNSPNWLRPDFSEADLRKELTMRKGGGLQNLETIEPMSLRASALTKLG